MSIEMRPMGVACNLACTYCYQEPIRKAGNINTKYDVEKMLQVAEETGQPFHLFGGEALLIPKPDLEKFFKRGYELYGTNGIQTNGTLIDDDHIEIFKKYRVSVGVSIDGPNELNTLRKVRGKSKNDQATLDSTKTIMENIQKLVRNDIPVGVILTIYTVNGLGENLNRLTDFIRWLGDIGVTSGNIHTLEVEATMPDQAKYVLTPEQDADTFLKLAEFFKNNPDLDYKPFSDMKNIVTGHDTNANCTWKKCDPMNTQSVYGVEGDGALSNCGRTNKEGIDLYKADDTGYERYVSFYYTPDELGGCQGCPFWMACSGNCPGEAIDGDFRNKSTHCMTYKTLLNYYAEEARSEGKETYMDSPLFEEAEKLMLDSLSNGIRYTVSEAFMDARAKANGGSQIARVQVKGARAR